MTELEIYRVFKEQMVDVSDWLDSIDRGKPKEKLTYVQGMFDMMCALLSALRKETDDKI